MTSASPSNGAGRVVVRARGKVSDAERVYAQDKIGRVWSLAPGTVLFARADLVAESDPARERPAIAKAELDVNGRLVRAHAAATTMYEAIDLVEARLRQCLGRLAHHDEAKRLRVRGAGAHEWQRASLPPPRPPYFPRPVEEREIVRHKSFAVGEVTLDEAAIELELLDLDFYLFKNLETGEDNVLYRAGGSAYEIIEPSRTCSLHEQAATIRRSAIRPTAMDTADAVELLDLGDVPFVFFLDPADHRGRLLYRRYDGHYGLIVPADEPS